MSNHTHKVHPPIEDWVCWKLSVGNLACIFESQSVSQNFHFSFILVHVYAWFSHHITTLKYDGHPTIFSLVNSFPLTNSVLLREMFWFSLIYISFLSRWHASMLLIQMDLTLSYTKFFFVLKLKCLTCSFTSLSQDLFIEAVIKRGWFFMQNEDLWFPWEPEDHFISCCRWHTASSWCICSV